jgi:uncharacterized membrane protein YjdF
MKALIATAGMFLLHGAGIIALYGAFDWYDIPMHFIGGMVSALWGLAYIKFRNIQLAPLDTAVMVLGIASFIAITWELHEFALDAITNGARQPSIPDTMLDFVMDILGSLTVIAFIKYER